MNEKEEGLFGVCNEAHIVVIWVLLFILICGLVGGLEKTNNLKEKIKNLEKKVEESVDIQKTYVIIETYKN
jgi:predicted histidine transporter YuiF (NhaC family)